MKKILLALAAVATIFAGCDKGLEDRVSNLENRVSEIEALLTELDVRVKGINTIVSDLQKNVYVTDVKPEKENGDVIGYTLTFTEGEPVTIYHGKKVDKGDPGDKGETLTIDWFDEDGEEGPEDGDWYWKDKDGWLTDDQDNKIPAVKPLDFEIKEGVLWVKVGNVEEELGSVHGDSWFEDLDVDNEAGTVTIVIPGASQNLVLPFNPAAADGFALELQLPETPAVLGGKITIGYTIKGCSAESAALVVYQLPEGWTAKVDSANGTVEFTTTENAGKVVLFAINNETSDIKAKFIDFDPEKLLFLDVEQTTFELPATGGSVKFPVSTGLDFKVKAPEWITPKKTTLTKAMAYYEYELVASENDGDALREGEVKFVNSENEEEVYFSFTVSQRNYNKAILGEYLESYIKSGMPQRGTLKIELSDDFTKGTYKVTICGETLYANYEVGKLLCYDSLNNPNKTYTREIKVNADYSKFENTMWSLGSFTITNYVALKPLGAPELTAAEQALVGTYDESWVYDDREQLISSAVMTISASEDAVYGRLKVKFLCVDGAFAECYATLSDDKTKLLLDSYGVAHTGQYRSIEQPVEFNITQDGSLETNSIFMGTYKNVTNYVATKVVESGGDSGEESGPLAGEWTVAYESPSNLYTDDWTSRTGTLKIQGAAGDYKITEFLGKSVTWALTENGNTLSYSDSGLELTLTYDETTGQLTTPAGQTLTDWFSFKVRNLVATR